MRLPLDRGAGLQRFPQSPWLAYGAAWAEAGAANWRVAMLHFEQARREPTLAPFAAIEANRIRRLLGEPQLPAAAEQMGPHSRLQQPPLPSRPPQRKRPLLSAASR